jgi:hypothetical protein
LLHVSNVGDRYTGIDWQTAFRPNAAEIPFSHARSILMSAILSLLARADVPKVARVCPYFSSVG